MTRTSTEGLLIIAVPVLMIGSLIAGLLLILGPAQQVSACGPGQTVDLTELPEDAVAGYSGDQLTNAALIMNAATALGFDRAGQIVGVMTAMGESDLRPLDQDSVDPLDGLGLFGQRGAGVWGSVTDRMDPTISATNFFEALQRVDKWQSLPPTIAAHRVQGNADPYFYEPFYTDASTVVGTLTGRGVTVCQSGYLVLPLNPGYNMTSNYGPREFVVEGASRWHAGDDLQHFPNPCHDPVFAITGGTVTVLAGYQLSIKSPDGYTVSYLHMYLDEVLVDVGDQVSAGQQIGATGSNGPSTGCHLHLAINVAGNTNPTVAELPRSETIGGPEGFVDPEQFYEAFGLTLCGADTCERTY